MLWVLIYGGIAGFSILAGAIVGLIFSLKQKTIARFMGFGSGALICALTFGLMEQAFQHGGFGPTIVGFLFGGGFFILGDWWLHLQGGRRHKRKQFVPPQRGLDGRALTLGTMLDNLPEAVALGLSLLSGGTRGLLMLLGIVANNFPEGISSTGGLLQQGFSKRKIFLLWSFTALLILGASLASFIYLKNISPYLMATIESFAAGAILALLADSMIPEAFEEGGFSIGFLTLIGFLFAFIIAKH